MSDFRKLMVWQKAHALSLDVHDAAIEIRGAHYAGLRNQLIRAASSVPANIVEGSGQESRREFSRFLRIAQNSASELEYHLMAAHGFYVITPEIFAALSAQTIEVRKMLLGLRRKVNEPQTPKPAKI